jgi:type I restriction enzyme S subunit
MANRLDAVHSPLNQTGVPDGWKEASVSELARIVGGGTPDRGQPRYWRGGTIPWITPTDLTANAAKYIALGSESISRLGLENSNATLVPKDSIVFSTRGTVGSIALAASPLTCNQSCEILVPRDGAVDAGFLYYLLHFGLSAFIRLSGGTTFGAITRRDIARVRFAVPSVVDEQAIIARILDAVDTALESTRTAVERARDLGRSLLEDAFEKLEAPRRSLRDFTSDVRYGTSKASSDRGWGNPVLRIPNVVGDRLALSDLAFVQLTPRDVERLRLQDGDLLLVRTNGNPNYVGRSVVFAQPDARAWVYASYLIRVRLKEGLLPHYLNVFLGLERGRRELLRRVTTSAGNHNINSNSIRLVQLPVPDDTDAQARIVDLARACRQHVDALRAKTAAIETLKRSLMDDLLSGRVRVHVRDTSRVTAS